MTIHAVLLGSHEKQPPKTVLSENHRFCYMQEKMNTYYLIVNKAEKCHVLHLLYVVLVTKGLIKGPVTS